MPDSFPSSCLSSGNSLVNPPLRTTFAALVVEALARQHPSLRTYSHCQVLLRRTLSVATLLIHGSQGLAASTVFTLHRCCCGVHALPILAVDLMVWHGYGLPCMAIACNMQQPHHKVL